MPRLMTEFDDLFSEHNGQQFAMYILHLDLQICCSPPMDKHGPFITCTRQVELPFPPYEGLIIYSAEIDDCSKPEGFALKRVVWDMDRKIFLATTSVDPGAPIGAIIGEIQEWIDRGWTLGSFIDSYPDQIPSPKAKPKRRRAREIPWEELEEMQENQKPRRPESFMTEFRAWIRFLAERSSEADAYAMDKSGVAFPQLVLDRDGKPDPASRAWNVLIQEYHNLSEKQQVAWLRKVRRYPKWTALLR